MGERGEHLMNSSTIMMYVEMKPNITVYGGKKERTLKLLSEMEGKGFGPQIFEMCMQMFRILNG